MPSPDVSVVIPVYNAMPHLRQTLTSVIEQSIGISRIEIMAVDDGSTDGSGEELESFAMRVPQLRVFRQPNSGAEGRPRNVGLSHATGRYVQFLDADDYLGPEALERQVAMADAANSDIVLGRVVGVDGRRVPTSMFTETEARVDMRTSAVWLTRTCQKLFRRAFLERLRLRFDEDLRVGADQLFTGNAYFDATVVSVIADYDCYYLRLRADGQNVTVRLPAAEYIDCHLVAVERFRPVVMRRTEPGAYRDHVSRYSFQNLARRCLGPRYADLTSMEQAMVVDRVRHLLAGWYSSGTTSGVGRTDAERLELAASGRTDDLAAAVRRSL